MNACATSDLERNIGGTTLNPIFGRSAIDIAVIIAFYPYCQRPSAIDVPWIITCAHRSHLSKGAILGRSAHNHIGTYTRHWFALYPILIGNDAIPLHGKARVGEILAKDFFNNGYRGEVMRQAACKVLAVYPQIGVRAIPQQPKG